MTEFDDLQRQIGSLRRRLGELNDGATDSWLETSPLVRETLEELGTTIEELTVSQEHLRVANEELALSRHAIEQEHERYRDLFDSAPEAYVVTDRFGTIREANRAAATLFGIEGRWLVGKPLTVYTADDDRAALHSWLARLPEENPIEERYVDICPRGGITVPVAVTVSVVCDREGEVTGLRWLIRDVSERKRAEAQARQLAEEQVARAEAEAANRAKSDFMAVMSHELRTPLTAIIGYSELMAMGIPEPLPKAASAQVSRIDQAAHHLLQLIEEILAFERLNAGRDPDRREACDLVELASEAVSFVYPLAERKGLPIRTDLPEAPLPAHTDHRKVRQVLVNLLSNAVKFTAEGEVALQLAVEADHAVFRVRDTGVGIAASDQKKIFEPFWQVEQGNTRQVEGTGLGLAISSQIVSRLGGELRVESTVGQGTTFLMRLPLRADAGGEPQVDAPDAA
ncbi:hypothetical protein BH23GEM3_BH23GEM3_17730 [soil metagenome]